jgi:hypothetical protein
MSMHSSPSIISFHRINNMSRQRQCLVSQGLLHAGPCVGREAADWLVEVGLRNQGQAMPVSISMHKDARRRQLNSTHLT